MVKFLLISVSVIAVVSGVSVNFEDLDNSIQYEEAPIAGISLPYPYNNRVRFVEPEPYYSKRYEPVIVPAPRIKDSVTNVAVVRPSLMSSIASIVFSLMASATRFIFNNAMALIIGTLSAFGVCKLTSICSLLTSAHSLKDVSIDLSSIATPERIARATEFVKEAIKKYNSYQK